jgi:hypothetical protein
MKEIELTTLKEKLVPTAPDFVLEMKTRHRENVSLIVF